MEKGLCLERTKVGSDDKQHAYAVSRRQGACIAGSIFIAFLVCAAAIIEFKAEMLTSAVQDRRMERIKEMAVREEHRPEAKLMRVSTRLEAHLMRDQQHRTHLKLYRERQQMLFDQYTQKIKGLIHAGSQDVDAIVKETHHFHGELRAIAETHTERLHKEGEQADKRIRELQAEILGELNAEAAEEQQDVELERMQPHEDGTFSEDAGFSDGADPKGMQEVDREQRLQAEQAVSKMLETFQERLGAVRRLPSAAHRHAAKWQKLLSDMDDGTLPYDEAEATMRKELRHAGVKIETQEIMSEYFRSVVDDLRLVAVRDQVMAHLRAWTEGTSSVHETLLAVQKLVNDGKVDPNWLIAEDGVQEPVEKH